MTIGQLNRLAIQLLFVIAMNKQYEAVRIAMRNANVNACLSMVA